MIETQQLHSDAVCDLYTWSRLLLEDGGAWIFPEINIQLNFYGQGDSTYLVIEVFQNAEQTCLNQYILAAENEVDQAIQLRLVFDFLKAHDYKLTQIVTWLETADFKESDAGVNVFCHKLQISRRQYSHGQD